MSLLRISGTSGDAQPDSGGDDRVVAKPGELVSLGGMTSATGLIERSAAAYVSGVPEDAADDALFGPASVAWRMSTDLASPVAGLRSLLMQALHPLAMAGVDQHSGGRRDPGGR